MPPFFTIITATYNAAAQIDGLIASLLSQTFIDYELVIQDGNSADNTLEIAESYRYLLPSLKLKSEPDTGIYDAWNRALERASGRWLLFLGADDVLAGPDVLEVAAKKLVNAPQKLLYAAGDVEMVTPDGTLLNRIAGRVEGTRQLLRSHMQFCHSGLFHRDSLFEYQRFDTSFRSGGDHEFLCRTWVDDSVGIGLDLLVTRMNSGGISSRLSSVLLVRWEIARSASRYFSGVWTLSCILGLAKGLVHYAVCRCVGEERAPDVLDRLRVLRGLPPAWRTAFVGKTGTAVHGQNSPDGATSTGSRIDM